MPRGRRSFRPAGAYSIPAIEENAVRNQRACITESDGRGNVGIRRIVVVGIAIVVDIAPIRRVTRISGQ